MRGANPDGHDAPGVAEPNMEDSIDPLIHILMQSSDEDRRMLSQIVERWGDLSDELKGVILAVVGSG
jgi:hypothetical protein